MEGAATVAERQDPLFRIVVSRYWVVAVSHHITTAFGITARDAAPAGSDKS